MIDSIFVFCFKVCGAAVGLTGDICRALKGKVLPYCDEIMTLLLENLGVSILLFVFLEKFSKFCT